MKTITTKCDICGTKDIQCQSFIITTDSAFPVTLGPDNKVSIDLCKKCIESILSEIKDKQATYQYKHGM